MPRLHLLIHGRVQGVFFRASAQEEAQRLQLSGWVRNRRDGAVEIVAEGDARALAALRRWASAGPPGAAVSSVEDLSEPASGEFRGFGVRS